MRKNSVTKKTLNKMASRINLNEGNRSISTTDYERKKKSRSIISHFNQTIFYNIMYVTRTYISILWFGQDLWNGTLEVSTTLYPWIAINLINRHKKEFSLVRTSFIQLGAEAMSNNRDAFKAKLLLSSTYKTSPFHSANLKIIERSVQFEVSTIAVRGGIEVFPTRILPS